MRIILAVILFLSIIVESTFLSFPFTLLSINLVVSFLPQEAVYWAFAGGVILDIFAFRILGISSIFFLSIVWTQDRFRKKFHQGWIFYQLFALIVIIALYSFFIYRHIDTGKLIIAGILAGLTLFGMRNILPKEDERKRLSI